MERHQVVPAVHLFLVRDGTIFMIRRVNTGWRDGFYCVVQGHIENDETPREATIREAKEEAGITVASENLEFVHVMHRIKEEAASKDRIDYFFRATEWEGEPANVEPEKADDARWTSLEALGDEVIPYIRAAAHYMQKSVPFSER